MSVLEQIDNKLDVIALYQSARTRAADEGHHANVAMYDHNIAALREQVAELEAM